MTLTRISALLFIAAIGFACDVPATEKEAAPPAIDGVFEREGRDDEAAIQAIGFTGDRYWIAPSGCLEQSCQERGTFAIDESAHRLELTVDGAGRKYDLPFEITSVRGGATISESARPAALVGGEGDKLVGEQKLVVGSIKLVGQSYLLDYDNCYGSTNDALTIARGICNGNKEPTKNPRIKCILMNDQDHCNGASKQSCLKDTAENDALSRYDQYSADCRNSGDIARETEASFNNGLNKFVMTVCCSTYTCADGVRIDGTAVTGKRGETVCGANGSKWWCGPGGKTEGVGEWKPLNVACDR